MPDGRKRRMNNLIGFGVAQIAHALIAHRMVKWHEMLYHRGDFHIKYNPTIKTASTAKKSN